MNTKATMTMANDYETDGTAPTGIQVICAGMGRTGTLSLTEALSILGYKPYHYVDFSHANLWARHSRGEAQVDNVLNKIVSDGYNATLENPTSDVYQDILAKYPNAKVVLTVRDSPDAFEASWKTLFDTMVITEQGFSITFPSFFGWIPLFQDLQCVRQFMGTTHLGLKRGELTHGWRNKPEGWLATQYTRHNQHVIDHVATEQLLVFNVKQGWKPLCDFLCIDIPEGVEFPDVKVNDTKALKKLKRTFQIAVYSWIPLLGSIGFGVWLGVRGSMKHKLLSLPKPSV